MLKGTRLFLCPQARIPANATVPNEINDFNGFTVPPETHETNGFNEITISRYPPEKHDFNEINEITISRPPNGITKATISTVS